MASHRLVRNPRVFFYSNFADRTEISEITVDYDANSNLYFYAKDKGSGMQRRMHVADYERISKEDLKLMMLQAEKLMIDDDVEEERIEAKNTAEEYVFALLDRLASQPTTDSVDRKKRLANIFLEWLDEDQRASTSEYSNRLAQLKQVVEATADDDTERDGMDVKRISNPAVDSVENTLTSENMKLIEPFRPPSTLELEHESFGVRTDSGVTASQIVEEETRQILDDRKETLKENDIPSSDGIALPQKDASPSTPLPSTLDISDGLSTLRSDTPRSTERKVAVLFSKAEKGKIYTDAEFIHISTYLRNIDKPDWSSVPRLYTVLQIIDQLDMLDRFIEQGITDIWFPFTEESLPNALPPTARVHFLEHQEAVLSKSVLFEKDADRKHANFAHGEPPPFQVVAILGVGAHGQVDKVMSTVSHREYARKLFRKRKISIKDSIKSFFIELQILKRVRHHHCIELVRNAPVSDSLYHCAYILEGAELYRSKVFCTAYGSGRRMRPVEIL